MAGNTRVSLGVQAAIPTTTVPTKSESTVGRVTRIRSVHNFWTGRLNRNGSDVLELLWQKYTKTQQPDTVVLYSIVGQKVSLITSTRCMWKYGTLGLTHYVTMCASYLCV